MVFLFFAREFSSSFSTGSRSAAVDASRDPCVDLGRSLFPFTRLFCSGFCPGLAAFDAEAAGLWAGEFRTLVGLARDFSFVRRSNALDGRFRREAFPYVVILFFGCRPKSVLVAMDERKRVKERAATRTQLSRCRRGDQHGRSEAKAAVRSVVQMISDSIAVSQSGEGKGHPSTCPRPEETRYNKRGRDRKLVGNSHN
jgi:hypothetical protein